MLIISTYRNYFCRQMLILKLNLSGLELLNWMSVWEHTDGWVVVRGAAQKPF